MEGALFRAGWLLGLRQPLAWGVGAGRCGLERLKEGEPGIAEGRRGNRIPATSPVISGPLRSREGRGEEGADARGRLVSGGAAAMRACWALAAPTGGAGGSGGSRAWSEPGCGAGVLGWQRKRAWAAEALGRSGSGWAQEEGSGPRVWVVGLVLLGSIPFLFLFLSPQLKII